MSEQISLEAYQEVLIENCRAAAGLGSLAVAHETSASLAHSGTLIERYRLYLQEKSRLSTAAIKRQADVPESVQAVWREAGLELPAPLVFATAMGGGSNMSLNMYYVHFHTGEFIPKTRGFLGNILLGNSRTEGTVSRLEQMRIWPEKYYPPK